MTLGEKHRYLDGLCARYGLEYSTQSLERTRFTVYAKGQEGRPLLYAEGIADAIRMVETFTNGIDFCEVAV